ncbi:MAG TPA: nucleoside triphosphate pyrophosphatase [Streptosporangiaceae bacterium]
MSSPARSFILASGSPSRLRVLRDAGLDPQVLVSGVDETVDGLDTQTAVGLLAHRKASAVAAGLTEGLVLGCDSLLDLDGEPLGKPAWADQAVQLWQRLAGRHATLLTGHCLIDVGSARVVREVASTVIRFGSPSPAEVAALVATGEPLSVAGAFTIEGFCAPFVDSVDGSPTNVLGLSMPLLRRLLADFGVAITDLWRPAR